MGAAKNAEVVKGRKKLFEQALDASGKIPEEQMMEYRTVLHAMGLVGNQPCQNWMLQSRCAVKKAMNSASRIAGQMFYSTFFVCLSFVPITAGPGWTVSELALLLSMAGG